MAEQQPRPILITGAGRRIGLALAHHFLQQRQPVIVSYRTPCAKRARSACRPILAAMTAF